MKRIYFSNSIFSLLAAIPVFSGAPAASALTITPISEGLLPTGEIISTVRVTLDPGDTVPWHYHSGPGWATVVSGVLTEDEGCGTAPILYGAGSAFAETPGRVHTASNFGTEPVVLTWTEIYPADQPDWIFVSGPDCEGKSGRSHLETIPNHP